MSKLVIINLGNGDLHQGFPWITVQLRTADDGFPEQFVGRLSPNVQLIELYQSWQAIYRGLCDRTPLRSSPTLQDDLEIDEAGITNVSTLSFEDCSQQLNTALNTWLRSDGFLKVEQSLRSLLHPNDEIRIIVETNDLWLWRLPWQQWEFLQDYPGADIALSKPEYRKPKVSRQSPTRQRIRVLAVLGNSRGIDLEHEADFLNRLPNTEPTFLVNPSRQELNLKLWDRQGWDILFFAGHSQTEGQTGRLYINEDSSDNSLTIEQLEEALRAAIEHGLKLAIFNSCDGLGLALALEKLNIPAVVVMREPVPNYVAQTFFDYFMESFVCQNFPLYTSVRRAKRKLQGLEGEFPGASWLPVICQNPAVEPPTWGKKLSARRYQTSTRIDTQVVNQPEPKTLEIRLINLCLLLCLLFLYF